MKKIVHILEPIVAVLVLVAVGYVLSIQLRHLTFHAVLEELANTPAWHVVTAIAITVVAYMLLSAYDLFGMMYVKRRVPWYKTAFASILSYIFSLNVGLSVIGASAMRVRLYPRWGLTALDIVKLVFFSVMTYWLGLLTLTGCSVLIAPVQLPASIKLPDGSLKVAGLLMLSAVGLYLILCRLLKKPLRFRGYELGLPSPPLAFAQVGVGVLDWGLAGTVLYILLPPSEQLTYPMVLTIFILAQITAQASHVPGGIGVLLAVLLGLLGPYYTEEQITSAVIIFRLIYFFGPLVIGGSVMGIYELWRWLPNRRYHRPDTHDAPA